jgi:hypothetical protein
MFMIFNIKLLYRFFKVLFNASTFSFKEETDKK